MSKAQPPSNGSMILEKGFRKFISQHYKETGLMPKLVQEGQHPKYLILSCIDSRVAPEVLFDLEPGTAFTVRTIGNFLPKYNPNDSASQQMESELAFTIEVKGITSLIIEGHTECSAAKALATNAQHDRVMPWINTVGKEILEHAKERISEDSSSAELIRAVEEQIVIDDYETLMSYPSVSNAVEEGKLTILPWLFDLKNGQVLELDTDTGTFHSIFDNVIDIESPPCCGHIHEDQKKNEKKAA